MNYYFLSLGIISVLFSFSHFWSGQTTVIPIVDLSNLDLTTKTAVFYTWQMSTVENFIFGIVFFLMSGYKDLTKVKFTVGMIISMVVIRYAVFFISTLFKNINGIKDAIPELFILIIYVGLMIVGIKKKEKSLIH